ncbi:hypothetical protein NPIL_672511 [Nephila pilipes]|uniref:Uncharacterized protein n=1 Tax=Nephila pilipes TaxID=299642 RepID=A0A8X6QZY0_NEPPI|nr:hypothetical protein NPIL_672511 [Nephila pilipes]
MNCYSISTEVFPNEGEEFNFCVRPFPFGESIMCHRLENECHMHNLLFPSHLSHFHPLCRPVGATLWSFSRSNEHFVLWLPIDAAAPSDFLPSCAIDELLQGFIIGEGALLSAMENCRIYFQKMPTHTPFGVLNSDNRRDRLQF